MPTRSMKVRTATRRGKASGPICSTGPIRTAPSSRRISRRRRNRPIRCSSPSSTMPPAARSAIRPSCASTCRTASSRSATSCIRRRCSAPPARPKRNICSRATSSTSSATAATSGSATTSTRRRSARRKRFGFSFEGVFRQHMIVKGPQPRHRLVRDARQRMAGAQGGLRALARARQFRPPGPPEDEPF